MKKLVLAVLVALSGAVAGAESISILAAASLKFVLEDIRAEFLKERKGDAIEAAYISSGKAYAQIKGGSKAAFFIAADTSYPQKVYEDGLAAEAPKNYARGKLVLFSVDSKFNVSKVGDKKGFEAVFKKASKVAMPDPRLAPYGRAAKESLEMLGINIEKKLVLGDSIGQATTFVKSGAAPVGYTALSMVIKDDAKNLSYAVVDEKLYNSLLQAQVITKAGKDSALAREFAEFILSERAVEIFKSYGYDAP